MSAKKQPCYRGRSFGLNALLIVVFVIGAHANADTLQLDPSKNVAHYIRCLAGQNITLVSAHRGGPKTGFPENALESLKTAIAHGPMLLEVDVRETADGQLVLLHDTNLDRTTTGKGALADYSLEELSEIRLVDNEGNKTEFSIPRLQDVLRWADDRTILQLDVKRGVDYAKVAQAVVAAGATDAVLIVAYDLADALAALEVDSRLSFSLSVNSAEQLNEFAAAGFPVAQLVAWTGVIEGQHKSIWPHLEQLNQPFAAGAFWHLEPQIIERGNAQAYIEVADAGVDIIGSDYYWLAYDTLAKNQNMALGLSNCEGQ